ncbi:MAG: hypothetical protein HYS13_13640 [Planctomycetia bacterium]|nr:hypothetical protein [Planctomycetia bacterium]
MNADNEVAILSRVIQPQKPELAPQLARLILRWEFSDEDMQRMHDLLERAKAGRLTRAQRAEAENYERVGHFLSLLKSKARASLKRRRVAS